MIKTIIISYSDIFIFFLHCLHLYILTAFNILNGFILKLSMIKFNLLISSIKHSDPLLNIYLDFPHLLNIIKTLLVLDLNSFSSVSTNFKLMLFYSIRLFFFKVKN